jgi:hypothetical protein
MIYSLALLFARVTGQTPTPPVSVDANGEVVSIDCNSDTSTSEVIFQAKTETGLTLTSMVTIDTDTVLIDKCVQIKTDIPIPDPSPGNFTSGSQKVVVFCDKANDDLYDVNATSVGYQTRQNNLITDIATAVGVYGDTPTTGKNLTLAQTESAFTTVNTNAANLIDTSTNNNNHILPDCTGTGKFMAWDATNDVWYCHS